jgi:hypothetical protein
MKSNKCSVDDCEKYVSARGLCSMHYMRIRRYGDLNHVREYAPPPEQEPMQPVPEVWRYRCLQCGDYWQTLDELDERCLGGRCPKTPTEPRYNRRN